MADDIQEPPIGSGPAQAAPFLRSQGESLDPTKSNWCGAFTNAVLKKSGISGLSSGGQIASNWQTYGAPVTDSVQQNDVLVIPRGRQPGQLGSHVGVATGATRVNPATGQTEYQMKSGNDDGNRVGVDWVPASQVVARRGEQMADSGQLAQFVKGPPPPATAAAPATEAAAPSGELAKFVSGPEPADTPAPAVPSTAVPDTASPASPALPPVLTALTPQRINSLVPPVVTNIAAGAERGLNTVLGVANAADAWMGRNVPGYAAGENWLGRQGLPVTTGDAALEQNKARAAELDAKYGGGEGYWFGQLAGETAATAPVAGPVGKAVGWVGSKIAGGIGKAIGTGAGGGGTFNALTGGPDEDPTSNPLANFATGAAGGAVLAGAPGAVRAGGRALMGGVDSAVVKMAERLNIPLSTGERIGGAAKSLEDASATLPMSGAAKLAANKNSAYSRVMSDEIGIPGSPTNITTPMLNDAERRAGQRMENAALKIDAPFDAKMMNDVSTIESQAQLRGTGTEHAQAAKNMVDQFLNVAAKNGGTIPGKDLAGFLKYGGDLDSLVNSKNPDVAEVGYKLKTALLDAGTRSSTASADAVRELQGGRQQWKAIQTVRPAIDTTAAGSEEISPQRLARLIQNKYDMTYTGAGNDMQDLARVINSTKPLPSSGTAERLQRMQLWSTVPGMLGIGAAAAAGGAGLAAYDPDAAEHAADALAGVAAVALTGRASRFGLPGSALIPRVAGGQVGQYGRNALTPPPTVNPLLRGVGPP